MYSIKNVHRELNVSPIKKIYQQITATYLKKYLFQPILHGIK